MIIRSEKNNNYTTICNVALNDINLSLKAKGLWAFIMSKPDNWSVSSRGLETQLKEGRDAIMAALKELEDAGYLERGEKRHKDGKWSTGSSVLHEVAVVGKPDHGKSVHGKAHHIVNTEQVSTKQDIETKVSMVAEATIGYGDREVNECFDAWAAIVGQPIQRLVKRNRQACYSLLKTEGRDKLIALLKVVRQSRGAEFAPVITDFVSLEFKIGQLQAWEARNKTPEPVNVGALLYPEKYGSAA